MTMREGRIAGVAGGKKGCPRRGDGCHTRRAPRPVQPRRLLLAPIAQTSSRRRGLRLTPLRAPAEHIFFLPAALTRSIGPVRQGSCEASSQLLAARRRVATLPDARDGSDARLRRR